MYVLNLIARISVSTFLNALRSIAPICGIVFLRELWQASRRKKGTLKSAVLFWAKVETIFFMWSWFKARQTNNQSVCHPRMTWEQKKYRLRKLFETVDMVFRGASENQRPGKSLSTIQSINVMKDYRALVSSDTLGLTPRRKTDMEKVLGHTPQRRNTDFSANRVMSMEQIVSRAHYQTGYESINEVDIIIQSQPDFERNESTYSIGSTAEDFLAFKRADFTSWFLGAESVDDLEKENVEEWILHFYLMHTDRERLDKDEKKQMHDLTNQVCDWLQINPKKGKNKDLYGLYLLNGQYQTIHRPLIVYLIIRWFQQITNNIWQFKDGFKSYKAGIFSYWHRPARVEKEGEKLLPLIWVHGFGMGISPFHLSGFLNKTCQELTGDRRDIIMISLPHFQQRPGWETHVPSVNETCNTIKDILHFHKLKTGHFIGHSMGTTVVASLIQTTDIVSCATLIDPVCISTLRSDIIYNNIFKKTEGALENIFRFFVFREPCSVAVLLRNTFPLEHVLDFDKLAVPCAFFIGGSDPIIPSYSIKRLLEYQQVTRKTGGPSKLIELDFVESATHGSYFLLGDRVCPIMKRIDDAAMQVHQLEKVHVQHDEVALAGNIMQPPSGVKPQKK